MAVGNFPLSWPEGWKRTESSFRKNGLFGKVITNTRNGAGWKTKKGLSISDGIERILSALESMDVDRQDTIISTNVRTRLDGLPRSGEREPDDPGVAVYWRKEQAEPMQCMAIDRYATVADNLAAVGATLDAMRAIERHGGAEILTRAFSGFKALPSSTAGESWWTVLNVEASASKEQVESAYRREARLAHPDQPTGNADRMQQINLAREQALSTTRTA